MNLVLDLTNIARDVRFAARGLRSHPGFAVATIATLGLAIGAAVTAISFIDSIYLRPLPAPSADRIVRVYIARPNGRYTAIGTGGVALLRERRDLFDVVAADDPRNVRFVHARGRLDQRFVSFVSADFFPLLGVTPKIGRFFTRDEDAVPGRDAVVVISASLWRAGFASDPAVVGERVQIGSRDFTIVGVAPDGFEGVGLGETPSQMWLPTSMMGVLVGGCSLRPPCTDTDVLARLAPGVTLARAQAELGTLGRTLSRLAIGDDSARTIVVKHASGVVVHKQREFEPLAKLLAGISTLLLLLACANLSGLLLARGVSREREIALRQALGASRARIVRQLLNESAVIALAGGALGVLLSLWTARGLMGFFASDEEGFPHFFQLGLDGRILVSAATVSLAATVLFGLLPALGSTRGDVADVLKSAGGGAPRGHARFGLIATQVALTTTLLTGAALLARSFGHLLHAQRFDSGHVAVFRVRPAAASYEPERAQRYVRAVRDRVASLPGVQSVAFARGVGLAWSETPLHAGVGTSPGDSVTEVETHSISPAFFSTLRIPVIAGREFSERDGANAPRVAMVSASVGHRIWPQSDPVGRVAYVHGMAFRIVGVVPDYQVPVAGVPTPLMIFVPFWQNSIGPETDARFVVRMRGDPTKALGILERAAVDVDPNVPVAEVMTMSAQVDALYPQIHLGQSVLLAAGGLALLLSAIGLYGMIAFLVARRTREIGVRVALGAVPARVMWQFVGQGMRAAGVGLAVGLVAAIMTSRFLVGWLVGITPYDAVAFGLASAAILLASYAACAIPARRAARVDPAIALRVE